MSYEGEQSNQNYNQFRVVHRSSIRRNEIKLKNNLCCRIEGVFVYYCFRKKIPTRASRIGNYYNNEIFFVITDFFHASRRKQAGKGILGEKN